ncbi:LysR substrate-binding domain-containing protein [Delftia sp. PS-11]|uniref:LysR substrate-binding domain-containing protein n=1 Tax=Delftia sp. PS-11 TaxID=2767222 RepID=UPI002454E547|nr:LysR substrate-binding domain-containing protein [Delftia sp. PS-11]KAJ8743762.1 LysR family transcriptional regulator [Delftia sp. PS-11]
MLQAGSARKAASLLGLSQPAVSKAIKRLEAEAGFPLFLRLRGRLQPTPEALALVPDVDQMYVGLSAIAHRIKTLREFGVSTLQIASNPAFGSGLIPRALARMTQEKGADRRPNVSLQIMSSRDVRERVAAGYFDLGFFADEVVTEGLECSIFADQPAVVVMPERHPLARHRIIQPHQLAEVPFLALNPEDSSRRRLEDKLKEHGVQLNIAIHTPYALNVCELALAGLGIGIVNPITALEYSTRGLTFRKLALDASVICMQAAPAGRLLSGIAKEFLASLRKQLAEEEQIIQTMLNK